MSGPAAWNLELLPHPKGQSLISTLLFDLAEVLVAGVGGVEGPIGERCGVPPETVLPALAGTWFHEMALGRVIDDPLPPEAAVRQGWFHDLMCGRISEDAYWAEVIRREGWRADAADLKRLMRLNFHRRMPGMEDMLARLAVDHHLVLVSDHALEWIEYIEEVHPFLLRLEPRYYSFETGVMKRDPSMFQIVLERLGVPASECLFVDDNARNIGVARSLGINGIRFENAAQLESLLPEHGVVLD